MFELDRYIEAIEEHLVADTSKSLTYAALESRLAIEYVCYERLRISHDYIAHNDLKKWQPKAVVNTLIAEVDPRITQPLKLSISTSPAERHLDAAGFEKLDYVEVGSQSSLSLNKLGKLWNALSNVALHVKLPTNKSDLISHYGSQEKMRRHVIDALSELKNIAAGTLIMTSPQQEVSIECSCGKIIRRKVFGLEENKIFHCDDPDCPETYTVTQREDDLYFSSRRLDITCRNCGHIQVIPNKITDDLPTSKHIYFDCAGCAKRVIVQWRLMQGQ